jgi:hypothetical protein
VTAHSPLGPSSAERWLNCPGSVALTAGAPDTESSHAKEGTVAHNLTEGLRLHGTSPAVGSIIDGVEVTQEMLDCVEAFVEYVNESPGDRLVEVRVCFDRWVPNGFGTLDDARMQPGKAVVTDFKYGKGVQVFATDNSQLKLYALGLLQEWDWLYDFQSFTLCVHQPRLDHIDTWSIDRASLLAWADSIVRPGAAATCDRDAAVRAGSWCQWCRIKTTCRVRAEAVFQTVVGEFESIEDAATKTATPRALLTNDEVAAALTAIGNVKKWCAEVEAYALAEIGHGRRVGDWKLVEGRSNRKWGLTEPELIKVWSDAGLSVTDLYEKKLKTPPAAEKVAGKKHALWKKADLVVKPQGKPTLAPGSDPRPVMVLDPNAEFDGIGEDDNG